MPLKRGFEEADDAEGHARARLEDSTDDAGGHGISSGRVDPAEDTEGHRIKLIRMDEAGDTEGENG